MAQLVDCYFLISNRSSETIVKFIDKYMPVKEECAIDYPVPIYADEPLFVFTSTDKLFQYLEKESCSEYSVYWQNINSNDFIRFVMVFHTDDGKMIFGLSVEESNPQSENIKKLYNEICNFWKPEVGCITSDEMPPTNSSDFTVFCTKRGNIND